MFKILLKSENQKTLLWEGQAGAAEKNIVLVYYSNPLAECVCMHVSNTSYLFTSLLYVEVSIHRSSCCFHPSPTLPLALNRSPILHCFLFPCVLLLLFITLSAHCFPLRTRLFQN